ncbi:MAG: RluA family pseudouridine synthase [Oscillospiraceae bacterium]|jgi:23S rRNA pseudouridine1911/1915/1917 synthase|nr:RluA family pseudouridine synthase [Oscillospiraceae bacterium]
MRTLEYHIAAVDHGRKVEDFLRKEKGFSGALIRKLKLSRKNISLNGEHIRMIDKLSQGDVLTIILEDEAKAFPNHDLFAPIVYEDDDVMIFDKPANMPVHPSIKHRMDTLANVFWAYCEKTNQALMFRPINRLDRDTTGLCVVAKNGLCASKLSGTLYKEYTAVCCGVLPDPKGTIDAPIARKGESIITREVSPLGQRAVTHYQVISHNEKYTLLKILLETGRTHQIRVHFSFIGHSLAGDEMYGGSLCDIPRHALHCSLVRFAHPVTNKVIEISCPLPKDMKSLVEA